jgi:hypothetical protein
MRRIITKELALAIKRKLCNEDMRKPGSPHDVWGIRHNGVIVGMVSIRRGSEKDMGHDYIPKAINVSPNFAKEIGICNKDLEDYLACLRGKGLIQEAAELSQTKELREPSNRPDKYLP